MGTVPTGGGSSHGNTANIASFLTAPENTDLDSWYADSGASNHITADVGNLSQKSEYNGKENVVVGNGNKLSISHIGSSSLNTYRNTPLLLKDVLHTPKITKNLISISKLTTDNDVYVEFFSDCCIVKDMATRRVVLEGKLKDVLYQLEKPATKSTAPITSSGSINKSCFVSKLSTSLSSPIIQPMAEKSLFSIKDIWHQRLGHPSNRVLSHVLSQINVKNLNNEENSFCDACQLGKSHALPFKTNTNRAKNH